MLYGEHFGIHADDEALCLCQGWTKIFDDFFSIMRKLFAEKDKLQKKYDIINNIRVLDLSKPF